MCSSKCLVDFAKTKQCCFFYIIYCAEEVCVPRVSNPAASGTNFKFVPLSHIECSRDCFIDQPLQWWELNHTDYTDTVYHVSMHVEGVKCLSFCVQLCGWWCLFVVWEGRSVEEQKSERSREKWSETKCVLLNHMLNGSIDHRSSSSWFYWVAGGKKSPFSLDPSARISSISS